MQEGKQLMQESLLYLTDAASEPCRMGLLLHREAGRAAELSALERAVLASNLLPARRSKIVDFLLSLLVAEQSAESSGNVEVQSQRCFAHCRGSVDCLEVGMSHT